MRVIFLEDIPHVARAGDIKEVKRGYAQNYLIPKHIAVPATSQEMARLDTIKKIGLERQSKLKDGAQALLERVESSQVVLSVRSGPNGKLYGAVTNSMIAQQLSADLEVEIDRRDVILDEPIHDLGNFQATLRLHPELTANIDLLIQPMEE